MIPEEKREYINKLYDEKKYIFCLKECLKLLKTVDKNDLFNYDLLFFLNYRISILYSMFNEHELSLNFVKSSVKYAEKKTDMIYVNWSYSFYYYQKKDYKMSLEYIEKTINGCLEIECEHLLYEALIHKALLTNDEDMMKESIGKLQEYDMSYEKFDEYYTDLFMLHFTNDNVFMANSVISKIKSDNIKKILVEKIHQCISSC